MRVSKKSDWNKFNEMRYPKKRFAVLSGVLLVTCFSFFSDVKFGSEYLRILQLYRRGDDFRNPVVPPVMHTYYAKKLEHLQDEWDTQEHEDMLQFWQSQWENAGWNTRILTQEDAKLHPMYETYQTALDQLNVSSYNHFCFHRWLAMSVTGGGWMSDYDVVPLHMEQLLQNLNVGEGELPHDGKFTSFCSTVPCLMVGSADEWDRVIGKLMSYVPEYRNEHFSDMFAMFRYFRSNTNSFRVYNKVHSHLKLLDSSHLDCDAYKGQIAWHFSHHAYHAAIKSQIITSPPPHAKSRAWYMSLFLEKWHEQCRNRMNRRKSSKYKI